MNDVSEPPRVPDAAYLARLGHAVIGVDGSPEMLAPEALPPHGSWEVMRWCPRAAEAALGGAPIVVVWHFQLAP